MFISQQTELVEANVVCFSKNSVGLWVQMRSQQSGVMRGPIFNWAKEKLRSISRQRP
jgi:hypothetical protein